MGGSASVGGTHLIFATFLQPLPHPFYRLLARRDFYPSGPCGPVVDAYGLLRLPIFVL